MEIVSRPAVRIVCLDADDRVLLMCWRDPSDGSLIWEPPGGGIEAGESTLDAARRELTEETGFETSAIVDSPLWVDRDVIWNGRRFVGPEPFYLARYPAVRPEPSRLGLMADEHQNLQQYAWLHAADFETLNGRLEPPTLATVIATLTSKPA